MASVVRIPMFKNTQEDRNEMIRGYRVMIDDHRKALTRLHDELYQMIEDDADVDIIRWKKSQIRWFNKQVDKLETEMFGLMAENFVEGFAKKMAEKGC